MIVVTSTPKAPTTGFGPGAAADEEGWGEMEDPAAEAEGDETGECVVPAGEPPRLHPAPIARTTSRSANLLGPITKATPFCMAGYVSGTIHALKKGASPHPQGTGPNGLEADGWCCPFCFM